MASTTETLNDITDKFKSVLDALVLKNYNVMNDVYFDMFITHLSGRHGEDYSTLLSDPFIFTWIETSMSKIISEQMKSVHGFAFTCQLLALLSANEENFRRLNERNVYLSVQNGLNNIAGLQSPSAKLAIITLYQSMLKHSAGIEWLKNELAWKRAITYCVEDQTIYVVRRAIEFITDFLFHIVADETLSLDIITEIIRPLEENVFVEQIGNIVVDNCDLQHKVTPSIDIMNSVLDRYVQLKQKSAIGHQTVKIAKGKLNLWKLVDMTHERKLFDKIMKCLVYMSYATLIDTLDKNQSADSSMVSVIDFSDFGLNFLNTFKMCIMKNQHQALLTGARLYYVLWASLGDRVPDEIILGNQLTKFENQVILFQILPLINVMHRGGTCNPESHEEYVMKLFDISAEHTLRICYSFRDSLINGSLDLYEMANKAIQGILSMGHVLHRDRAVIVFQALWHIIKGVAYERSPKDILSLAERPTFMSAILTGLYTIVKQYRITWKESYESIGLLNCMLYAMEDPNLSPKLAVEVLKLAQLSIEHFLAPNLALLVDTLAGSDMQKLGPMILKRLHDNNWEVRDSAMELLSSMVNISMLKFPAFQEHILSNGLCPLVVETAKNDAEYYVRASALSCISQMVPVNMYWEHCISSMDLIPYLITVIQNEYEGVVRKEAVSLITSIYENQKVPSNQLETIYPALAYSAVHDLYWEVKVKALDFWHSVVKRQLHDQGVIDGTFPSVTFSKEKKKIVTLTQKEITLRLTKVLDQLSVCGCLGVLLACLDDEDDLLVVKGSIYIMKWFTQFLEKYNFWAEFQESQSELNRQTSIASAHTESKISDKHVPMETLNCSPTNENLEPNFTNSDEVIQSIISTQDLNLLTKTYENQMNVDPVASPNHTKFEFDEHFRPYSNVTPKMFMEKTKATDLDALIKRRTEWLAQTESFSSLLNDMLYSLEANEANEADCY